MGILWKILIIEVSKNDCLKIMERPSLQDKKKGLQNSPLM